MKTYILLAWCTAIAFAGAQASRLSEQVDLFKHGDPAGAASRMLAHLDRHVAHASARDWAASLEDLLTPEVSSSGNPHRSVPETIPQPAEEESISIE